MSDRQNRGTGPSECELKESRAEFKALFESVETGILLIDQETNNDVGLVQEKMRDTQALDSGESANQLTNRMIDGTGTPVGTLLTLTQRQRGWSFSGKPCAAKY